MKNEQFINLNSNDVFGKEEGENWSFNLLATLFKEIRSKYEVLEGAIYEGIDGSEFLKCEIIIGSGHYIIMINLDHLNRNEFKTGICRKGQDFTKDQEVPLFMTFVLGNKTNKQRLDSGTCQGSELFASLNELLNNLGGIKEDGIIYSYMYK